MSHPANDYKLTVSQVPVKEAEHRSLVAILGYIAAREREDMY